MVCTLYISLILKAGHTEEKENFQRQQQNLGPPPLEGLVEVDSNTEKAANEGRLQGPNIFNVLQLPLVDL